MESGSAIENVDDVTALIRSNRKVVELLNEQLKQFEDKETTEE